MVNPIRQTILITVFALLALLAGFAVANIQPNMLFFALLAVIIFGISFVNIELGLYILIFSMLLSPEIMAGGSADTSLGRGVTLRFEDFLLVIIGISWFAKNAVVKELGLFIRTPINKAILCYVTVCLVATLFGIIAGHVTPKTGLLFVLKYIEYFVVYFMIANHVRSAEQIKRFLFCLFLTAFIVAVIGMLQTPLGERVSAPFEGEIGEPNTFGGYLLLIGCVAAGLIAKIKTGKIRMLLVLLVICLLPPFFLTQSRASYLAAVPAILALGLMVDRKLIVLGVLMVGILLSPVLLPSVVKERILFTFNQPKESGQIMIGDVRIDTSTSARLNSWKLALSGWTRRPVIGYGVTGFEFMDAQFPRVMVETGIVGLAAFLYLIWAVFKMALTNLKKVQTPLFKGLIIGFICGFIGLLVHSIGANTFIIVRIMEPFWFFAGMVAVLPSLEKTPVRRAGHASAHDTQIALSRLRQVREFGSRSFPKLS